MRATGLVEVTFPGGSVRVRRGTTLARALNLDALRVETPCGGRGRCRKCLVRVVEGDVPPSPHDREMLWPEEIEAGLRLACRLPVMRDITVSFEPAGAQDSAPARPEGGTDRSSGTARERRTVCETGDSRANPRDLYGAAIDLGTTTIAGSLIRLSDGREVASGTVRNPQASAGADVMTRLSRVLADPFEQDSLQEAALGAVASLVRSMAGAAGTCVDRVVSGVLVGNSAMHHLALGFDVSRLAAAPYCPAVTKALTVEFPGLPRLWSPPLFGGFAGSDAVAATLAEGLHRGRETRLLIDLGTNTEIVLAHRGCIYVCSAPAGPAFEGAEISHGMLASVGAIESVSLDDGSLRLGVIGGGDPVGLCGSGLLDATAALLVTGFMDCGGRLRDKPGERAPGDWAIEVGPGGTPSAARIAPHVSITQKDIRVVQLAKGSVRAGIEILLDTAGATAHDIGEVLLAGTFGSFARPESVIAIGLLPQVPRSRVKAVGNAALRGAKMMLHSDALRREACDLAESACHVSLHESPDFEEVFLRSLDFPKQKERDAGVQEF